VNGTIRAASINAVAATNVSSILYAGGFTTSANTATLSFQTQGGGGGTIEQRIQSRFDGTNYGISIDDVLNSKTDNLRITNGRIGINCNSPRYGLDVNGSANYTQSINITNCNVAGTAVAETFTITNSQNTTGISVASTLQIFGYNAADGFSRAIMTITPTGRIGLGTGANNPGYQLDLETDGARKLTTTAWLTGSDERIKKNISSANLELCYSTLKQINLKYFEWDRSIPQLFTVQDRHSLGFIAQEIKPIFPNAVTFDSNMGYSNFHSLNVDQLYKMHFGATKKLMELVEQQGSTIQGIQQELSTLRS
jgi:hypothetical protein